MTNKRGFTGSLLAVMLKAINTDKATNDELSGFGRYAYQPVSP